MLIPDATSAPLLEATLQPEASVIRSLRQSDDGGQRADGSGGDGAGDVPIDVDDPRELPVVRVEPPLARLAVDIPGLTVPGLPDGRRLYVVRFDISLRPKPRVRIEWARFRAQFLPDADGRNGYVEDQHPFLVERAVSHHVSLTVNPSLKFSAVEASAGSYAHGYDYESLEPRISAAGRGGADLSWDYDADPDGTLTGGKRMHALLTVPAEMGTVRASLSIVADLRIGRFVLPARPSQEKDARLDVEIVSAP
jgi:hypothetical protein